MKIRSSIVLFSFIVSHSDRKIIYQNATWKSLLFDYFQGKKSLACFVEKEINLIILKEKNNKQTNKQKNSNTEAPNI